MCGIAGLIHYGSGERADRATIKRMTDTIAHRGPDGEGVYVDGPVGLGHRRLAIIDVAGGLQPMTDPEERLCIVFNGEIYNFPELRAHLETLGYQFRTRSDTEVVLYLYQELGPRCVEQLRGMFAFAIWDKVEQRLFLARDRVGKKPLYYADLGHTLLFASEAKAILAHPAISRQVDLAALDDFLTYQYVPAPRSMFHGISKLPPAHYMVVEEGKVRVTRYWDLNFLEKQRLSDRDALERMRPLLEEAVRIRMISDVPLGAFLSGGVDSSLVVALMARQSAQPVKTFSIGFTDQAYNELPYARKVAEMYGTQHEEFICTADLVGVVPKLVWHFDEPFADSSAIPTYYLSQMTRRHVTVALNGDGGDEGFAGYERYLGNRYVRLYKTLPRSVRSRLVGPLLDLLPESAARVSLLRRLKWLNAASLSPRGREYSHSMTIFRADERAEVLSREVFAELSGRDALAYMLDFYNAPHLPDDDVDRMLYSDTMTYLPGDLLVKVDRMTMAHSLEGRSPLLDHKVLEFAASLPGSQKLRGTNLKYLLKKLGEELLPHDVLYRPKQGFGVPIASWFRNELRDWVTDLLAQPAVAHDGLLRADAIARLVQEHTTGRVNHGHRLWALINLELWYRMFIRRESGLSASVQVKAS
jgi:asparagine synthase (glutamine-hydrolysing)